jgi:hypothetical protein
MLNKADWGELLKVTVAVLLNGPIFTALYTADTLPVAPEAMGSLVHSGWVQPQEVCT